VIVGCRVSRCAGRGTLVGRRGLRYRAYAPGADLSVRASGAHWTPWTERGCPDPGQASPRGLPPPPGARARGRPVKPVPLRPRPVRGV